MASFSGLFADSGSESDDAGPAEPRTPGPLPSARPSHLELRVGQRVPQTVFPPGGATDAEIAWDVVFANETDAVDVAYSGDEVGIRAFRADLGPNGELAVRALGLDDIRGLQDEVAFDTIANTAHDDNVVDAHGSTPALRRVFDVDMGDVAVLWNFTLDRPLFPLFRGKPWMELLAPSTMYTSVRAKTVNPASAQRGTLQTVLAQGRGSPADTLAIDDNNGAEFVDGVLPAWPVFVRLVNAARAAALAARGLTRVRRGGRQRGRGGGGRDPKRSRPVADLALAASAEGFMRVRVNVPRGAVIPTLEYGSRPRGVIAVQRTGTLTGGRMVGSQIAVDARADARDRAWARAVPDLQMVSLWPVSADGERTQTIRIDTSGTFKYWPDRAFTSGGSIRAPDATIMIIPAWWLTLVAPDARQVRGTFKDPLPTAGDVDVERTYWDPPNNTRIKSIRRFRDGEFHAENQPAVQRRSVTSSILTEQWWEYGRQHRVDGPAETEWREDGTKSDETWYENGKQHRVGGPAWTRWDANGTKVEEAWWENGRRHRVGGPAWTAWFADGTKVLEQWWENGEQHRVGGPAVTAWYADGTKGEEQWWENGQHHRVGAPAITVWRADGTTEREDWWENGERHRVGGPAVTRRHADGTREREEWWENGQHHRVGGPARTLWYADGMRQLEEWVEHTRFHSVDGPARTWWRADGTKEREVWYENGERHRAGGPAWTRWRADGTKEHEVWWENGQRHRVDGPAETVWRADGTREREAWWETGRPHRVGGPAETAWRADGTKADEVWWDNGIRVAAPADAP